MGQVGRFRSVDAICYPRGKRVIVRTRRGLEMGHILVTEEGVVRQAEADGEILRAMTVEDDLLAQRLEKNKHRAFEACRRKLEERSAETTLIDVELLFDGRSLYFYFLGEVTPRIDALTAELSELYEAKVKFRQFTEAVIHGCGPDCGTQDARGGCDHCSSCSIAGACGTARVR